MTPSLKTKTAKEWSQGSSRPRPTLKDDSSDSGYVMVESLTGNDYSYRL